MKNFGLTEEEKNTHLQQYNHALFQNSLSFMDVVWEINLEYSTIVILEDRTTTGVTGLEYQYVPFYENCCANRVQASDRALFVEHMNTDKLRSLRQEDVFYLHLLTGGAAWHLHRVVLTPSFDERGEVHCVYLGALDLFSAGPRETLENRGPDIFQMALVAKSYFHFELDVTAGGLIWGDYEALDGTHPIRDSTGMVDPVPYSVWVDKWYELYEPQFDKQDVDNIFSVEYFTRAFENGESLLDLEVKQKNPRTGEPEFMHIYVVLTRNPADGHIIASVIWRTISEFRSRIMEKKFQLQAANEDLTRTISQEEQFRLASLSGALMVYNINLTRNLIEDEFYEIVDGTSFPMLRLVGLTAPCDFDTFCHRWSEAKVPAESRETFLQLYNRDYLLAAYERGEYQLEIEFDTSIGRGIPVTLRNTILLTKDNESGDILAMVNGKDVTDQRREEKEKQRALQAAFEAADQANKAKTEFLSRMSHDIRTPMHAILGMTTIAQREINDPERVADCLSKIDESGKLLLELMNKVLDMSKIESGDYGMSQVSFSVMNVISEVEEAILPAVKRKGQQLTVEVDELWDFRVMGDPLRVQEVLMNFLTNANKYTGEGGHIRLAVTQKEYSISGGVQLQFVIEDDGVGMTQDFVDKIFLPFERAEDSRISKNKGTGLGMTIAQNLVQRMDGSIQVESQLGRGSRFTVTMVFLPVPEGEVENSWTGDEGQNEMFTEPQLVLLVDDNDLNREIARTLLEMSGVEVEEAVDGQDAVDKFAASEEGKYKAILMDIQMPVMNGYDATRAIRALPREDAPEVPIIALSANAFSDDVRNSLEAGMNAHLGKPLEPEQLIQTLKYWIH